MINQDNLEEKIKLSHDDLIKLVTASFDEADYYYWHAFTVFQEELERKYNIKIMSSELEQIFSSLANEIFSQYGGVNDDILNLLRILKYSLKALSSVFTEKIIEKGSEKTVKEMLPIIMKRIPVDEQYNNVIINELKRYANNITLKIEEIKKNILFKQLLHPTIVKILYKIGIDILNYNITYNNEIGMILSPDHTIGITSIENAEKFIEKISKEKKIKYRETTSNALNYEPYYIITPSNVKYPQTAKEIVRILKTCIVLYPDKPAPLMLKKQSLNFAVLIANIID